MERRILSFSWRAAFLRSLLDIIGLSTYREKIESSLVA
jgi:hypothetical protein